MIRALIIGNSGSGKSTCASRLAKQSKVAHLDLDTIAWKEDQPGVREELGKSFEQIDAFLGKHDAWVIEGCYASLITRVTDRAEQLLFLNPGVTVCQENCRNRPWEPHKYPSKEAQDKNLAMLLAWVADYETREDEFSLRAHCEVFEEFTGEKREMKSNEEAAAFLRTS